MFRSITPGAVGVKGAFDEQLKYAKLGGFEGLDGGLQNLPQLAKEKGGIEGLKNAYKAAGIRAGGMGLPQAWRSADEAEFKKLLAELPEMARIAREIGASGSMTFLSPKSDTLRYRENFKWHVQRLRPCAQILRNEGLRLGLEFVGPRTSRLQAKFGFLHTHDGIFGLSEAIGTGNVGLLLDSWHWYTIMGTQADLDTLTAEDVVHVHINDAPANTSVDQQMDLVRALPGETGVIDLKMFLTALKNMGYQGAVTPEPFSAKLKTMASEQAAKTAGEALMKVWKDAGV
ncbi:MAG: sugar phosphate isomerase/epimerase [Candidatus Sumerlaeota bacterium]|nr:sugar phosphate isomerase/epimerase [Candidatus Sumerlaeota bacterium]